MAYQSTYTGKQMDLLKNVGFISLSDETTVTYTLADTYYPISGTYSDGGLSNNFTDNGDGTITYNGEDSTLIINGTTDNSIDGITGASIAYGLFRNGSLIPGAETPHDFELFNTTENFSITALIPVSNGDVFEVRTKCDDAGRTLTVQTLNVTFGGK